MKMRPRIRRATLWGGVVVSAVLAVVWLGSMVWFATWETSGNMGFSVGYGSIGIAKVVTGWGSSARFAWGRVDVPLEWWVLVYKNGRDWMVWVPLWMPLVVSLGVTAAAWRLEVLARRRARMGKCASCGYDRAGLKAGAVCPECGGAHGFVGENR
jgi:hypothetical protein